MQKKGSYCRQSHIGEKCASSPSARVARDNAYCTRTLASSCLHMPRDLPRTGGTITRAGPPSRFPPLLSGPEPPVPHPSFLYNRHPQIFLVPPSSHSSSRNMRFQPSSLALSLLGARVASAAIIDVALSRGQQVLDAVSPLASALSDSLDDGLLEITNDYLDPSTSSKRKLCVLHPRGDGQYDDDNFKKAHEECGNGGIIRLPDAN